MFLSINTLKDDSLRDFVRNKDSMNFDKNKYKVFMYFFCAGAQKLLPLTGMGKITTGGFITLHLSEITTYPLSFILVLNSKNNYDTKCLDITEFSDFEYSQKKTYDMAVPVYETNTLFPLDFRSKKEIIESAENSETN